MLNPVAAMITAGGMQVPSREDHTVGFDRLHGSDDLDAAGAHGVE